LIDPLVLEVSLKGLQVPWRPIEEESTFVGWLCCALAYRNLTESGVEHLTVLRNHCGHRTGCELTTSALANPIEQPTEFTDVQAIPETAVEPHFVRIKAGTGQ
jgi:hypothetical protein